MLQNNLLNFEGGSLMKKVLLLSVFVILTSFTVGCANEQPSSSRANPSQPPLQVATATPANIKNTPQDNEAQFSQEAKARPASSESLVQKAKNHNNMKYYATFNKLFVGMKLPEVAKIIKDVDLVLNSKTDKGGASIYYDGKITYVYTTDMSSQEEIIKFVANKEDVLIEREFGSVVSRGAGYNTNLDCTPVSEKIQNGTLKNLEDVEKVLGKGLLVKEEYEKPASTSPDSKETNTGKKKIIRTYGWYAPSGSVEVEADENRAIKFSAGSIIDDESAHVIGR